MFSRFFSIFLIFHFIIEGQSFEEFRRGSNMIKDLYLSIYQQGHEAWQSPEELKVFNLKYPPYICQPYVRPSPEEHLKKMESINDKQKEERTKRAGK